MEEEEKRICPLSLASTRERLEYCYRSRCEWWDETITRCALAALAIAVRPISDRPE